MIQCYTLEWDYIDLYSHITELCTRVSDPPSLNR